MHNYRSSQSALMTRCGTDFGHQYGIFGGESQTSVSRNASRPGAKKDSCFRRLPVSHHGKYLTVHVILQQICKLTGNTVKLCLV